MAPGSIPGQGTKIPQAVLAARAPPQKNTGQYPLFKANVGFPGGTVVKNPPANAGDTGSSPGPGRSHMLRSN